jgi:hypothetical protein
MPLLRLVTWSPDAPARQKALEAGGFKVSAGPAPTKQIGAHFRDLAPDAIVIDMDRLPSHGRAVGVILRTTKSTRLIPIVFVGGEPEKIARARADMADACFTDWKKAPAAIKKFLREPTKDPIQPPAYMDQFAGSSLIKKLGFKAGMKVAMLGAPDGFEEQLGELPEGLAFAERMSRATQLALWFVRSRRELESEVGFMGARLPEGCSIWIVHPKQSSTLRPDFNQNDVRNAALAVGLVDYKVCAVDSQWSGLKFTRKKT